MGGFEGFALTALAHVEAGQGRFDHARRHAEGALEVAHAGAEVVFL
jgi:hypothetical protein